MGVPLEPTKGTSAPLQASLVDQLAWDRFVEESSLQLQLPATLQLPGCLEWTLESLEEEA